MGNEVYKLILDYHDTGREGRHYSLRYKPDAKLNIPISDPKTLTHASSEVLDFIKHPENLPFMYHLEVNPDAKTAIGDSPLDQVGLSVLEKIVAFQHDFVTPKRSQ